ncbi:MAG: HAD family hydrolase [Candidatus Methanomethylophilaceae archaeon]|nr:HAD family hydrolase [Candidatus Methanomethylophilaceae archaeon]
MMRYKAIGFDMDGTLIDSVINYEKLANVEFDVLTGMGVPADLLEGKGDKDSILAGLKYLNSHGNDISKKDLEKKINTRAGEIESESVHLAKAYPGVDKMLTELRAKGYRIGLLTRGQRMYAEKAMGELDLLKYMDALQAYDDHPIGEQKPNPIAMRYLADDLGVDVKDILYVGDNLWDYFCARDAGSAFIGVASGANGRLRWERYPEVTVVDNVADIVEYL